MKKKLLSSSFLFAVGMSLFAQNGVLSQRINLATDAPVRNRTIATANRNITCSPDTVQYTYLKESLLHTTTNPTFYTTYWVQNEGMAQAYKLSAAATINGVEFYGKVKDLPTPSQTLTVNVSLYSVDAAFKPLTQLATKTCLMTTTGAFRQVIFTTPVAVSSDFAVVIMNPSATDTMQIYVNNADVATYGEGLGYLGYGGAWYQNLDGTNGFGQDLEALAGPIIQYNIATDYTVSPSTSVCEGTPMTFTNTTTAAGIVENYMFNYNLFKNHFQSTPDSTYAWDMGDASAIIWSKNANYAYPTAGTYNATLYTLTGLFTSCMDTKATALTINTCVGIDNTVATENVSLYPNPATDVLNITNAGKDAVITIMNSLGQVVYGAVATDKVAIDTKNLSEGIYFVRVNNQISKIVITK